MTPFASIHVLPLRARRAAAAVVAEAAGQAAAIAEMKAPPGPPDS